MSMLAERLAEIKGSASDLEDVNDLPNRTLQAEKAGWSKKVCESISLDYKIPSSVRKSSQQISIANRFLTFYATGYVPSTHEVSDIILATASLIYKDKAKNSSDLIWRFNQYSDNEDNFYCGFSIGGEPPLAVDTYKSESAAEEMTPQYEETLLKNLGSAVVLINETNIVFETTEARKAIEEKTPFALEAFKILADNPVDRGFSKTHIGLIRVLNFLALTMLRKIICTEAQMTIAFLEEQYKKNILSLVPGSLSMKYSPPTKFCIEALAGLSKNDPAISSFIAKLVILRVDGQEKQPNAVIGATILTHLAWYKMEILDMIFEVCNHFAVSWKKILNYTLFNTTKESWREIISFCAQYLKKNKGDYTTGWARVIDDAYFTRLAISRHINLAALLVDSVIAAQNHDGIFNSKWASDHSNTVKHYREASIELRHMLAGTNGHIEAVTPEAQHLVSLIKSSKGLRK